MNTRYKLRLKAFDDMFYTDKTLRLEHKGVIALAKSWFQTAHSDFFRELAEIPCSANALFSDTLVDKPRD